MGTSIGWLNWLLIVAAVANAVIGTVVLARNISSRRNQYFFGLSVGIAGWSITNVLFQIVSLDAKYALALLSYAFAGLLAVFFLRFGQEIAGRSRPKYTAYLTVIGLAVSAGGLVPGVIAKGITPPASIETHLIGLIVYGLTLLLLMGSGISFLVHGLRSSYGKEKSQIVFILFGLAIAAGIGVFCNLILPLTGSYSLVAVGPTGSLFFIIATAYAILHHKLFDIRLILARTLGYGLALIALAAMYGLVIFASLRLFFDIELSLAVQAYFVAATSLVGAAFPVLKKFFDHATDTLFYRDAYDPQALFDKLNRLFVSSLDIDHLMKSSADMLVDTMRVEYCLVGLRDGDNDVRLYGTKDAELSSRAMQRIRTLAPKVRTNVIILDNMGAGTHDDLRELMRVNNIAALIRLEQSSRTAADRLGYVVLGFKKSGNAYGKQDATTLEVIANSLVLAIQNALRYEEIERFNETLQAKVDTATAKLRQANERLKVLNETKDDFVSMASHQLRTPLTSIKGYLSMVLEGDMGKITAGQRTMIEQAFTSSQRMAYLISDLLNMSRLRTGRLTVTPGTVSLNKIIDQEIAQLKRMAEGGNVKLIVEEGEDLPSVALDETKIRQVIMNLVDNAIYYTGRGGTVTVRLSQTPKSVELRVIDTGIGVPVADQHKLFTRFYRASNAKKVRPDGTGIGLYMVRKVVTALGGSVIFNSVEGKGSTFGFSFPKVAPKVLPEVTSAEN